MSSKPGVSPSSGTSRSVMKNNLILAVLLAVLTTFALWYEYKHKPQAEKKEAATGKLVQSLNDKDVTRVRIVNRANETDVVLSCKDGCKGATVGNFEMESPLKAKADDAQIHNSIGGLGAVKPQESVDISGLEDPVLAEYGLDSSKRDSKKVEVTFKGESTPTVVYIGEKSPVNESLYVLVTAPDTKADKVHLVASGSLRFANEKVNHWRNKRLFDFTNGEVSAIEIKGANGTLKLAKGTGNESGTWYFEPAHEMADSEAVESFLTGVGFMTATHFVSDQKHKDKAKLDIKSGPKYALELKTGDKTIRAEAYENNRKPAEHYLIRADKDFIAKIDLGAFQKFQKKRDDFRIRSLLRSAEKFNVAHINAGFGKDPVLEIKQEQGKWVSPGFAELDAGKVDQALTKIGSARVKEFKGKTAIPAAATFSASYELLDAEKKLIRKIAFHKTSDGKWFAKTQTGEVMELDAGTVAGLPVTKGELSTAAAKPAATPTPAK